MRSNKRTKLAAAALAVLLALTATPAPAAQQPAADQAKNDEAQGKKTRKRTVATSGAQKPAERMEPDDTSSPPRADVPAATLAARHEGMTEEEASVAPYYNNFLSTYRLGPEDVISIRVFGPYQDRYSVPNIVVPPNAVISHPLIPEGVFVGGKTTEQVAAEITKRLDEYVIGPKVTVSLDKAQSAVFWVVGDVAQPGIRPMSRRLSVTEALALSGGVLDTGNKKKVMVMRRQANGFLQPTIINVAAIERGQMPDNYFLNPGDQVIVPGNRMKNVNKILGLLPVISFFRIFTGGF